jgi:putative peptidoglycan lipid II flippase
MVSLRGRDVSWRVLFQMATVGAYTSLVKVAGAAKVVFTARAFGMSDGLDAYLIAFLLPSFVSDTLAGSLNLALVPTFIEVRETEGRESAARLYRTVLAASAAWLGVAAIVFGSAAPWLLHLLASSFSQPKLTLTVSLFWVMLAIVPITAFSVTWRSILNTEGWFAAPAVLPALTPIATIVFLLRFGAAWGVYSLAAGTLVGSALEAAFLAICMKLRGFSILPKWFGRTWALDQVARQYGPVMATVILLGGAPLIDQSIAAMLASGSVAALNYGTRFSTVLTAVGPSAVATAILPHFSKLTVTEDWARIRRSLRGYAAVILTVTVPVVVALIAISQPLVRLFFERGQFTGADTGVVARIQQFSLLQIPPAMVLALTVRLISSMKANQLLLRAAGFAACVNLIGDLILTRWIGVAGITLATAIVQFTTLFYLIYLMRRRLPARRGAVPSRAAAS